MKICFFLASNIESNVNGDDKHGTLERGASGADTLSREVWFDSFVNDCNV